MIIYLLEVAFRGHPAEVGRVGDRLDQLVSRGRVGSGDLQRAEVRRGDPGLEAKGVVTAPERLDVGGDRDQRECSNRGERSRAQAYRPEELRGEEDQEGRRDELIAARFGLAAVDEVRPRERPERDPG